MSRENHPEICDLLFNQVEKPKNIEMCRAINVYSNKYRVNIYTRSHDSLWDIDTLKITQSYFCTLNDKELSIRA